MENLFCTFASGSSGNCSLYASGGARVLIDAGTNAKYITSCLRELGLAPSDLTHILITHGHSDHTSALPVLMRKTSARIVCSKNTYKRLNVAAENAVIFDEGDSLTLGTLAVKTFATCHDISGSCGFVIGAGESTLGYCTDIGMMTDEVLDCLCGCNTVVLESNHDIPMLRQGRYPQRLKQRILGYEGHLSNDECAICAARLVQSGTRHLILAHLSDENNTPRIARKETEGALARGGLLEKVTLHVAPGKSLGEVIIFGEGEVFSQCCLSSLFA